MKRRADVDVLSRPLLSCGRTSPLIDKNAPSGRRPSNDPDDNETISQRAKQLTWRLLVTAQRSPVCSPEDVARCAGGGSEVNSRATQRRSQDLLGIRRLPRGLVSRACVARLQQVHALPSHLLLVLAPPWYDVKTNTWKFQQFFATHWLKPKPTRLPILLEWDAV